MALEGSSEASVTSTSSTNPNWWDIHANPISSWASLQQQLASPPNNSSSCCDEDVSVSCTSFANNLSDHSGLSVGSSSATEFTGEAAVAAADNHHLWRHALFNTGKGGEDHLQKNHGNGESNFLESSLTSKNLARDIFGPSACDYLKKLEEGWEFEPTPPPTPSFVVPPANLSDLVSNWSIAPPRHQFEYHGTGAVMLEQPNKFHHVKHDQSVLSAYGSSGGNVPAGISNYGRHESVKEEIGRALFQPCSFLRPISTATMNNTDDLINFGESGRTPKPSSSVKSYANAKRLGHDNPSSVSSTARGHGKIGAGNTSEGKKKRSEDYSEAHQKRSKQETSTPSGKFQVPKVKLGEKITALQQIVSPFGKTDTASVLLEAINCIRILHEQVQLLSDPFMKSSVNKELATWGGVEINMDKKEMAQELSSRGLCLFPISWIPKIYRENTGPDYWTPTYRGCLYR